MEQLGLPDNTHGLLPHAPVAPVLAGMVLAGALLWAWSFYRRTRQP